jgi:hypothetical protein
MNTLVSVGMFDAATVSQTLTEYGRGADRMGTVMLSPVNEFQSAYLSWYNQNWLTAQQVRVSGYICDDEVELSRFLAQNGHGVRFPSLDTGHLGAAAISDLSGGLHVITQPTHIITDQGGFYKGLRVEMNAVTVYYVPGLTFPLVKLSHSKNMDFWMTIPDIPFDAEADIGLYEFATHAMKTKIRMYDAAERLAYIEIPEVNVIVCREGLWLSGLEVNGSVLQHTLQVCPLEISKGNVWGVPGPIIASETLTGPPPLSFNTDFVVWASHLNERLVSPVIQVPANIWESV